MNRTKIHCIIPAIERHLKLQVVSVILRSVSYLADELCRMHMRLATFLALLLRLDQIAVIKILISLLGQASYLFLSHLPICASSLHFSELTVVHLVALNHKLFIGQWHVRPVNNQIDVSLLRQLQIVNMVNILSLQVDSNNSLLTVE